MWKLNMGLLFTSQLNVISESHIKQEKIFNQFGWGIIFPLEIKLRNL